MSGVLVVDWLGRGGIAQTTEAWVHELSAAGHDVCVVTRAGRELGSSARDAGRVDVVEATGPNAIVAHCAVVAAAAKAVRDRRPSSVVVQNYVVPSLEDPLRRATREVGCREILVVHDHRPHSLRSGTRVGLQRAFRSPDVLVAHSGYVAAAVGQVADRDVRLVPHPMQVGMLASAGGRAAFMPGQLLLGLHFGTLRRRYKGSSVVEKLVGQVPRWTFAALGAGAPPARPGLESRAGWVSSADLVATVAMADAAVLPYRRATQSGAVVLAQALGVVPVASAVGGVPEQIDDGVDGLLVEPHATGDRWRAALERLADDEHRKQLAAAGRARVEAAHAVFATEVRALVT